LIPKYPDRRLAVTIAGLHLRNPFLTASGTYGFGEEYRQFYDPALLGAVVTKGLTLEPRRGNSPPRIAETPAGMLNSIGLENPGVDAFIDRILPRCRALGTPVIVNIAGNTPEEYGELAARLNSAKGVAGLEVNVSCPNVKEGGLAFGVDPGMVQRVTGIVRHNTSLPVIVKLSPNVTDISEMALAAEAGGADVLSLVNTFLGMEIDVHRCRPVLGNIFGGLSGPAVRPLAVRMVWQVYEVSKLPLIGMGGIMTVEDVLQFILAGAQAVAVGTAHFVDPEVIPGLINGLQEYLDSTGLDHISDLVGKAHRWKTASDTQGGIT